MLPPPPPPLTSHVNRDLRKHADVAIAVTFVLILLDPPPSPSPPARIVRAQKRVVGEGRKEDVARRAKREITGGHVARMLHRDGIPARE